MPLQLVDPEVVTRRGFDRHDAVLAAMVKRNTAEQFYKLLEKRLGPGQARAMTYRHYKGGMQPATRPALRGPA